VWNELDRITAIRTDNRDKDRIPGPSRIDRKEFLVKKKLKNF
jgi:hypothetical protein